VGTQERVENRLKELYGLEAQPEDDDDDDELPPVGPTPAHDDVQDPYDEEQAPSNALASRFFVRIANDRVEVRKLALATHSGLDPQLHHSLPPFIHPLPWGLSVKVSVDASGELLHRRGIRQHVSDAPLRETIAAAWYAHSPTLAPFLL
jgi:hypothetical protein